MKKNKKFSVAISVYKNDNPEYFDIALDSITNQTINPNEIVLVVDGPVPKSIEKVIDKYIKICKSKKIELNVIKFRTNKGLGHALKIAVENSKNELIARMDSDDIAIHDRFEQQLKWLEENEKIDIVGGDITEFIENKENIIAKRCVPIKNEEIKEYMKKRCAMNHVTVMFKKSRIQDVGGYLDWHFNEDYYLWIRMYLKNCTFANTGTVLVNVRVGEEMYQRRGGFKYFKSEFKLQNYMLKHKMITFPTYVLNVLKRFVVQIILTNKLREFVFKKFARN